MKTLPRLWKPKRNQSGTQRPIRNAYRTKSINSANPMLRQSPNQNHSPAHRMHVRMPFQHRNRFRPPWYRHLASRAFTKLCRQHQVPSQKTKMTMIGSSHRPLLQRPNHVQISRKAIQPMSWREFIASTPLASQNLPLYSSSESKVSKVKVTENQYQHLHCQPCGLAQQPSPHLQSRNRLPDCQLFQLRTAPRPHRIPHLDCSVIVL